jgi:hypothetical protein
VKTSGVNPIENGKKKATLEITGSLVPTLRQNILEESRHGYLQSSYARGTMLANVNQDWLLCVRVMKGNYFLDQDFWSVRSTRLSSYLFIRKGEA